MSRPVRDPLFLFRAAGVLLMATGVVILAAPCGPADYLLERSHKSVRLPLRTVNWVGYHMCGIVFVVLVPPALLFAGTGLVIVKCVKVIERRRLPRSNLG